MAAQKIALVTGAGTGVGRAVRLRCCAKATRWCWRAGAAICSTAVARGSQRHHACGASRRQRSGLDQALFAKTKETYGRLDLLFNNAGIGAPAMPIEDLPLEKWQAVVDTNLTGLFLCTQEAIQIMKAQEPRGGRIINNGSISAHTPRPGAAAYTATKHAVTGLTKQTALDCRSYEICCGQIDIGNAATPLTERMVQGEGVLQPDGRKMIEPRMEAEDVGRAVVYMASLPLDTNVLFMTVMANMMPFVGRG